MLLVVKISCKDNGKVNISLKYYQNKLSILKYAIWLDIGYFYLNLSFIWHKNCPINNNSVQYSLNQTYVQ